MKPQELPSTTIKIAACWPELVEGSGDREAILQQHESIRWAFNTDLQMLEEPAELIVPEGFSVVVVEECGISLKDFQHPAKAVYVTGNTTFRFPSDEIERLQQPTSSIKLDVPSDGNHPLYGHQALAIVLNDRRQKMQQQGFEMLYEEHENKHRWCATHRGQLVGHSSATQRTPGTWYLHDSYVDTEFRQQGIFSALHDARMQHIEGQNPKLVMSICNQSNYNTYRKHGFHSMHTVEDYGYEEFLVVKDYT